MTETRDVQDPFIGKTVQVNNDLVKRLRGQYAVGPTLENGEPEFGWRQMPTVPIQVEAAERIEKLQALVDAVIEWCGDSEGVPGDPSDARLLQAVWRYEGDRLEPCPECDGECGEPCAPTTAASAIAALERWSDEWMKKRGIVQAPAIATPTE
jgi:hypothetical protein